jgi:hypothetical protein
MQVDDTLFRVNECMFDQGSEKAARLLARKAERPDGVILLEDATATDFERFLSAVYCKYVERHGHVMRVDDLFPRISDDPPLSTEDDWASVLKLSHRFGFKSMHRLAAKHLLPLTSYIDRVVLAHAYEIDSWLPQAYMDVCELALLPSPADAHRLGFDVFIKIATARQQIYSVSGCVNLSERSKIIKNLFGSPSTPASVKGADISVSFEEAVEVPHPTESPPPRAPVRASSPPVETQSSPPTDQAAPAAPPALASTGQIDASGSATLETLSASSAPPPVDAATPKPAEKGKAAERGPSSSSDRSKDAQVNRRPFTSRISHGPRPRPLRHLWSQPSQRWRWQPQSPPRRHLSARRSRVLSLPRLARGVPLRLHREQSTPIQPLRDCGGRFPRRVPRCHPRVHDPFAAALMTTNSWRLCARAVLKFISVHVFLCALCVFCTRTNR